MKSEIHLFVIWEKARCIQKRILNDIALHFTILKQYEITWSPSLVASNFTRFCGTRLGDNLQYKISSSGKGEFLVVVVRDDNPVYESRSTFHGVASVNVKMFEAKQRYRQWTGGGIGVHATDNTIETNHDLTLLIGKNVEDFITIGVTNNVEKLYKDLEGARGWQSIQQLFYVLNNTVRYATMRGYGELSTGGFLDHKDTDIMTDDYENLWLIVNSPKKYPNSLKPKAIVQINETNYLLDIWNCGWDGYNYFDPRWVKRMIDNAIEWNGIRILNPQDDFYCLLYHCLTNKGYIADDYLQKLMRYKQEFHTAENDWNEILVSFLKENQYEVIRPQDTSNPFNLSNPIISQYAQRFGVCYKIERYDNKNIVFFEKENSVVKKGPQSLIDNEYSILKVVGDGLFFQKPIDSGVEGKEGWMELSAITGVDLEVFLSKWKNLTLRNIRNVWLSILDILERLEKRGIKHGHLMAKDILINESTKHVSMANFEYAILDWNKETPSEDLLSVAKIFSSRFGNVEYIREVSSAQSIRAARIALKRTIDVNSVYGFYRRKYSFIKTYLKNPKSILAVICSCAPVRVKRVMLRLITVLRFK